MRRYQAVCTSCGAVSPLFKHVGFARASKHDCELACRTCGWRKAGHGLRRECSTCWTTTQAGAA